MINECIDVLERILEEGAVTHKHSGAVAWVQEYLKGQRAWPGPSVRPPRIERWRDHEHAYQLVNGEWRSCPSPEGHVFRTNAAEWMRVYYPCQSCHGLGMIKSSAGPGRGWCCARCSGSGAEPEFPVVNRTEKTVPNQHVMQVLEMLSQCPDGWSISQYAKYILGEKIEKVSE